MNTMRPNEERARAAVMMIWAVIVVEIITMISTYLQYDLLRNYSNGITYTDQQLEYNDLRVQLVTIIYWIFFITTGIVFIMWFRRAYYNLHQRTSYLNFKEGWAAASWLIPIVNLFRPFIIMKELFVVNENLLRRSGEKSPAKIPYYSLYAWWTFWLINNVMIQVLNRMAPEGDELQQLSNESLFYVYQSIVAIIAGILLIKIIKAYNKREMLLSQVEPVVAS